MKELHQLTRADFQSFESGQIRAGIRHWIRTAEFGLEDHECYQYKSVEEIVAAIQGMQAVPGMEQLEVVTHGENYRQMKVLYRWQLQACITCANARQRINNQVHPYPGTGHGFCSQTGHSFLPRSTPHPTAPPNTCWQSK